MTDGELLEYISESSTMSKAMDEYDGAPRPPPGSEPSTRCSVLLWGDIPSKRRGFCVLQVLQMRVLGILAVLKL